jgi:hypothetical protein
MTYSAPLGDNILKDFSSVAYQAGIGHRHGSEFCQSKSTGVRGVEEELSNRNLGLSDCITSDVSHVLENVGTDIPSSKSIKTPVGLDSGESRIMCVNSIVGCADQLSGHGIGDENGENIVGMSVISSLVKVEEQEGIVHERCVIQKRFKEANQEFTTKHDISIMGIILLIRCNENVLREFVGFEIILKRNEILNVVKAIGVAVEEDRWAIESSC